MRKIHFMDITLNIRIMINKTLVLYVTMSMNISRFLMSIEAVGLDPNASRFLC